VGVIEVGIASRKMAVEFGVFPAAVNPIRGVSSSLAFEGNPLNGERKKRADWAEGLSIKTFTEGMEILYFPCCYLSYDPRLKKAARSTAAILKRAGVEFGILGDMEACCGESIRKAGEEDLFRRLAKENIRSFIDHGVKKILVSSPHCYHAFKNEYAQFRVNFEVIHISQFLLELIHQGRLGIRNELVKKITYHDPCYLGRHNGIYDEPREVLKSIPGLKLLEMPEARADSFCCGGGGGRIWMETPKGERFSDLRLDQAVGTGAEILITSCPYCITNFEDSRMNRPDGDSFAVREITELLQEAT
jgi:Fe-S oxidoreductase